MLQNKKAFLLFIISLTFGFAALFMESIGKYIAPFPFFLAAGIFLLVWKPALRNSLRIRLAMTRELLNDRTWRIHLIAILLFWVLNIFALGIPGAAILVLHAKLLSWIHV